MRKIIILLLLFSFLTAFDSVVFAQGNNSGQETNEKTQQKLSSPQPSGNAVQNQNQIKTQNKGEEIQIQVQNQEQESEGSLQENQEKNGIPRSENAREHMSAVADKVEELLTADIAKGGVGEEVRQVAQEQKEAQEQIQSQFQKIESRKGILKFIIGPDFQALNNMQKVIEQNRLRIQELTQLKNQLTNQSEIDKVQEVIQALVDQNTALQDKVSLDEKSTSLFGWLFRLFAR